VDHRNKQHILLHIQDSDSPRAVWFGDQILSKMALGPTCLPKEWVLVKQLGSGVNHPPPSSTKVTEE